MAKKQVLTNADIEKDIITALKTPQNESEASYKSFTIPAVIIAIILIVIEFIYPIFILWLLLALIVLGSGISIFQRLRLKNQIKNVTINDYTITTETVHSTAEEHYRAEAGGAIGHRRTKQIDNYNIRFENGKTWRIPKENHLWSERYRMSDSAVFASTHRGDNMIVITKNANDEIVMAYNTKVFEYKKLI